MAGSPDRTHRPGGLVRRIQRRFQSADESGRLPAIAPWELEELADRVRRLRAAGDHLDHVRLSHFVAPGGAVPVLDRVGG